MNKTLYISDLDGTLLNNDKKVTKNSVEILNKLMAQGLQFSVATARTAATVGGLLKELQMSIPVVLMNGVALYDLKQHTYIDVEYLGEEVAGEIMDRLASANKSGFIYTIEEGQLQVFYNKTLNKYENMFYEERKHNKLFTKQSVVDATKIIYFVFMDVKEKVEEIAACIKDIEGIDFSLYKDNYMEDAYLLEVYSQKASKSNGILKLKDSYKYEKIVCFGDNLNDLSMFKIADYSCAMANAAQELKEAATEIIVSNEEDGVANFIKKQVKRYNI